MAIDPDRASLEWDEEGPWVDVTLRKIQEVVRSIRGTGRTGRVETFRRKPKEGAGPTLDMTFSFESPLEEREKLKGVGHSFDTEEKELENVWDCQVQGWRFINMPGIRRAKINGVQYRVTRG